LNLEILFSITHILGTTSILANFILPILLISLIILMITVIKFISSKNLQKQIKMRKISQSLLHVGIIIALIGVLISYNNTEITDVLLKPNSEGYVTNDQTAKLKVVNVHYEKSGYNYARKLQASVQLIENNRILGSGVLEYTEYSYFGLIVNVIIISGLTADYYLTISTFTVTDSDNSLEDIRFQIRVIPMVNLLWVGSILILGTEFVLVVMSYRLFLFSYRISLKKQTTTKYPNMVIRPIEGLS